MNNYHAATKQPFFTLENAQNGANLATEETGIRHKVIEDNNGVFFVVIDDTIQTDNAPPAANSERF